MEHFVSPKSHPLLCEEKTKLPGQQNVLVVVVKASTVHHLTSAPTYLLHTLRYQVFLTFPVVENNNAVAAFPSVVGCEIEVSLRRCPAP
jgi:hypothetical protein